MRWRSLRSKTLVKHTGSDCPTWLSACGRYKAVDEHGDEEYTGLIVYRAKVAIKGPEGLGLNCPNTTEEWAIVGNWTPIMGGYSDSLYGVQSIEACTATVKAWEVRNA